MPKVPVPDGCVLGKTTMHVNATREPRRKGVADLLRRGMTQRGEYNSVSDLD